MSLPRRLPDSAFLPQQGPCAALIADARRLSRSAADAGMARLRAAGR